MTEQNNQELTATPAPVEASTVAADAVKQERDRIQGIEGLKKLFANAPLHVQTAASKVIEAQKFDADATAENTAVKVMEAMNAAFASLTAQTADGAREAASVAAKLTPQTEPTQESDGKPNGLSSERIKHMAEVMKTEPRR